MLLVLFAGFGGLALHSAWVLVENSRSIAEVERREAISDLYHSAEVALLSAETEGTRFTASRDPADRERFEAAIKEVSLILISIAEKGDSEDAGLIFRIFSDFSSQMNGLSTLLDGIESGTDAPPKFDTNIVTDIRERLQVRHKDVAGLSEGALADFKSSQRRQAIIGAAAFGLGAPLVIVLLLLLHRYQREEDLNEMRLASLGLISRTDGLTGIGNLRAFNEYIEREAALARDGDSAFSLVMLDIDHFKRVNDEHGHVEGDGVLATLAVILQSQAKALIESCEVFRLGGDEFALVLPSADVNGAERILHEIRFRAARELKEVTFSAGVATQRGKAIDETELRDRADKALYHAKNSGRDQVVSYNSSAIPQHPFSAA